MKTLISGLELAPTKQILKQIALTLALVGVIVIIGVVLHRCGVQLHLN
jgi:hypothetical protein